MATPSQFDCMGEVPSQDLFVSVLTVGEVEISLVPIPSARGRLENRKARHRLPKALVGTRLLRSAVFCAAPVRGAPNRLRGPTVGGEALKIRRHDVGLLSRAPTQPPVVFELLIAFRHWPIEPSAILSRYSGSGEPILVQVALAQ